MTPRKPGRPSEGKQRKSVWFDADVWNFLKDLPKGKRGKIINAAIRKYFQNLTS